MFFMGGTQTKESVDGVTETGTGLLNGTDYPVIVDTVFVSEF